MARSVVQRLTGQVDHLQFVHVDSGLVLAAARSQGVELIDAASRQVVQVVAEGRPATALIALPGREHGETLLVGGPSGQVEEIHPRSGQSIRLLHAPAGEVRDFAVTQDAAGAEIVVVAQDTGVCLWRTAGSEFEVLPAGPRELGGRPFKVCVYRHEGRPFLACALTNGDVALWDLADPTAAPSMVRKAHTGPIWSIIDVPVSDGTSLVATGGSDQFLRVWAPSADGLLPLQQYRTGGTIRRLGHVVEADVPMLVTASAKGPVELWRFDGPAERAHAQVTLHDGEVYALACESQPESVLIASGDFNGDILLSRLTSNVLNEKSARVVGQLGRTIWAIAAGECAAGRFYAYAGVTRDVYVHDAATGDRLHTLEGHASTVRAMAFGGTATDAHLVSGGADHAVYDWNPDTGERRELKMAHDAEVWAVATAQRDGRWYAVTGGPDGTVRTCPLDAPNDARVLARDCGEVTSLAVVTVAAVPYVIIASTQGLLRRRLDGADGLHTIVTQPVAAVATVPYDEPRVVIARPDGQVELYDPMTDTLARRFAMPLEARQVRALAAHRTAAGDPVVFGGCDNGDILKWGIDGRLIGRPTVGGTNSIRALRVDRDQAEAGAPQAGLIAGGHDGVLRYWPISRDKPLSTGGALEAPVRADSILLQDQPADADLLARDALTKTMVDALTASEKSAPVVIGVHAPWGQGKSSVLRQIQHAIDPRTEPGTGEADQDDDTPPPTHRLFLAGTDKPADANITPAWAWKRLQQRALESKLPYEMRSATGARAPVTAWFNPWMYERTEQIWAGLTREILTAVTSRLPEAEQRLLYFDLNLKRTGAAAMRKQILQSYRPHSLKGALGMAASALVICAAIIGTSVAIVNTGELEKILGSATVIVLVALGVLARLIFTTVKGFPIWYDSAAVSGPVKNGVDASAGDSADPLETTDRGYLYLLQHDVRDVIDLATRHSPLYIFIDDMDRCSPAIVADTVEAINLFLTKAFGPCVFVLALDPATVAAHLESAAPGIHDRAKDDPVSFGHLRHTGWRFMEKIVDLPVRLPRIPDVAVTNYLEHLLMAEQRQAAAAPAQPPAGGGTRRPATTPAPAHVPAPRKAGPPAPSGANAEPPRVTHAADGAAAALAGRVEDIPSVREALHESVLNLPGRNPRQMKAFINLWRFYMVLEYELGFLTNSLTATQVHCVEMARLVEIMVRWPWLLDALGAYRTVAGNRTIVLDRLGRAAGDDTQWADAARTAHMNVDDEDILNLRELLIRPGKDLDQLVDIARRYL